MHACISIESKNASIVLLHLIHKHSNYNHRLLTQQQTRNRPRATQGHNEQYTYLRSYYRFSLSLNRYMYLIFVTFVFCVYSVPTGELSQLLIDSGTVGIDNDTLSVLDSARGWNADN